jgi:cell division septation protein DedD
MARGGKGGGDRVLESRHLVGLFLGVVLLCGVFFTLGYVMGKTQFDAAVHAAESGISGNKSKVPPAPTAKDKSATPSATPANDPNWDNYDPTKKNNDEHIELAPKAVPGPAVPSTANSKPAPALSAAKSVTPPVKQTAKYQAPAIPKNAIVLQVAAVKQQRDALEMADELQRKKFPAFVTTSPADNYYRVQIGPYPDVAAAQAGMRALEQAGFKAIIKR